MHRYHVRMIETSADRKRTIVRRLLLVIAMIALTSAALIAHTGTDPSSPATDTAVAAEAAMQHAPAGEIGMGGVIAIACCAVLAIFSRKLLAIKRAERANPVTPVGTKYTLPLRPQTRPRPTLILLSVSRT